MRILRLLTACAVLLCFACNSKMFRSNWLTEQAPANYTAAFETTKGNFEIDVVRERSPLAADRFYQLVKHRHFTGALFYRVVPNFVAQFDRPDSIAVNKWPDISDEPVLFSNKRGTVTFARSGKNSRGTTMFINLKDNPRLDTVNVLDAIGFPAFGEVTKGMEVVDSLYKGYGNKPMEHYTTMMGDTRRFLDTFPKVDKILRAKIIRRRN